MTLPNTLDVEIKLPSDFVGVLLLFDATPSGYQLAHDYVQANPSPTPYYRLRVPFTAQSYTPQHAVVNPLDLGPVIGRLKWLPEVDLVELYGMEPLDIGTNHQVAPFIHPNMYTGLSKLQTYVKRIFTDSQSVHELACRCLSRFDVDIFTCIEQVQILIMSAGILSTPTTLISIDEELPFLLQDLVTRPVLRDWLIGECARKPQGVNVAWDRITVPTYTTAHGELIEGEPLRAYLLKWFHLKLETIVEEKRFNYLEWNNPLSEVFLERVFLRTILVAPSNEKSFLELNYEQKRSHVIERYGERMVDRLLSLPVSRLGKEIYRDLFPGGRMSYCESTARELYLTKLNPAPPT